MKRNMLRTMDRLRIDENIRGLIRQMWKHCYRTQYSCQGGGNRFNTHNTLAYMIFKKNRGDGWFEENAEKYGLKKIEKLSRYGRNLYEGKLIPKPDFIEP